jgi:hypothetical protein
MGIVYLLGVYSKENTYKIGVTRGEINKRIKQLQTGNSGEIYLVDSHTTKYPFFIEHFLHMQFFPNQKVGEWFELCEDDICKFKEFCAIAENNAKALEDNPYAIKILK